MRGRRNKQAGQSSIALSGLFPMLNYDSSTLQNCRETEESTPVSLVPQVFGLI